MLHWDGAWFDGRLTAYGAELAPGLAGNSRYGRLHGTFPVPMGMSPTATRTRTMPHRPGRAGRR